MVHLHTSVSSAQEAGDQRGLFVTEVVPGTCRELITGFASKCIRADRTGYCRARGYALEIVIAVFLESFGRWNSRGMACERKLLRV
jgi:hypothetical protein